MPNRIEYQKPGEQRQLCHDDVLNFRFDKLKLQIEKDTTQGDNLDKKKSNKKNRKSRVSEYCKGLLNKLKAIWEKICKILASMCSGKNQTNDCFQIQ